MNTVTQTTWSGTQAPTVIDALNACLRSKMVKDYFDDAEKEALTVLLKKAEAGHSVAITPTRGLTEAG
ncbi:hypothetical protein LE191_04080 [Janthinobacterium sp. HSC-3S05]|uniref:hypothetical protein n=1 Tax=Janthinobacterium lividum TaxID=29581 RepID=UPI001CD8F1BA|nr:hypothetical protein [Janthinobacterium lividum]MCA1859287.1 hypothetical protein [Janthinobacterium lividum]MCL6483668.1 hypothetical protein [Janthinobacterium lividum]